MAQPLTASDVIDLLGLQPHPEGGHYRETFRDAGDIPGGRGASSAIFFLLAAGERSHWHKVDAAEVWHFYAGAPLVLSQAESEAGPVTSAVLGPNLAAGQRPQIVVPADVWQAAEPLGGASPHTWTLVGCTVAPAFVFPGFELAPAGWQPKS
ncbi:hypothetical protein BV133_1184 [Blastochloris viridis]|nr:hypothetical protein BV133_1184 [Blastochloris viridis]